ncbi:MAG: HAD family hydrolase [Candidatus Eisenbacteria bacterium]|nr:HAD family hydrolase [Candidatus Eisenbacteria bacterium]
MTTTACPSRAEALALLHEWVENPALRKHCRCVEAAMRAHAARAGEDPERWGVTGLIHDFDWERHPDLERHPVAGVAVLREKGWPEDICVAVLGHATHTGVARESLMAKTLFAVDELCGFIVACSLVLPDKSVAGLEARSVKKKLGRADFARNVSRDDIVQGAAELGVELDAHIEFTLNALKEARMEWEQ